MIRGELIDVDNNESLGIVGDLAFEYNGEKYYVGDIVNFTSPSRRTRIIIRRKNKGNAFVSGFKSYTNSDYNRAFEDFKKMKPYTELVDGERCDYAIALIKHINKNKRIL